MTHSNIPPREPARRSDRTPSEMLDDAPHMEPRASAHPIHIVVDLNRCQAYAQCCFLAPGVFKLHGEEALWYDGSPNVTQREHVLRAAAACPVQAITVEGVAPSRAGSHKKAKEPHAAATRRP
jgi:ferredoxin